MCGCVWEKNGLTCYHSDTKCIRAGEYINAGRTLQHKPLSTTEGQRVALMNVGSFTEIRGDSMPGMCPDPRWIDYPAPRSPADSFVMAGPIRHCLLRAWYGRQLGLPARPGCFVHRQ